MREDSINSLNRNKYLSIQSLTKDIYELKPIEPYTS